jgi:hypothetical protein
VAKVCIFVSLLSAVLFLVFWLFKVLFPD